MSAQHTYGTSHTVLPPISHDVLTPETYRQIFSGLRLPQTRPAVIGVTSSIGGEGRTTVACGLAATLSVDLDIPITLIEVDMARPALTVVFDLAPGPGLCEVLRDGVPLRQVTHRIAGNLEVITAGGIEHDTARLLRQLVTRDPLRAEEGFQGIVVLDLPPLLPVSYSALVAAAADALVMVVRAGITPIDTVRAALRRVEQRPPQGIVFNASRPALPRWWPGRGI